MPMPSRRLLVFVLLLVSVLLSACERTAPEASAVTVRGQLEDGRRAAAGWVAAARAGDSISTEQAVALGYLERLRLGLGSPFRLIEFAQHDPRLSPAVRTRVGWALLGRTAAGTAYELDPALLGGSAAVTPELRAANGRAHLELIQAAIREAADPRAGELAVRLGYSLAVAEGALQGVPPRVVARVAALTRDRELAQADARLLLDSARMQRADALGLLRHWRSERRLSSEAPYLAPLPGVLERQALELAPRLAAHLRELSLRSRQGARPERAEPAPLIRSWSRRSLLPPAAAELLLAAADSLNMPPLAPITVALRGYLLDSLSTPADGLSAGRRQALARAATEEALVGRLALLGDNDGRDLAPSMAMLWAAAGLRTMAQEPVWYPGFGGPTAAELESRFGLAAVNFDERIPAAWRPYYRGLIQSAIEDLQRVLPALDVRGLRVRFDASARQEGTLALHDPRSRQIILSPSSAAGTLAHEIAHDLDWQVARRRYHVRGDYATDRLTRERGRRTNDPLALMVQDLYAGVMVPPSASERLMAHARRPAEVFARNIDWFVAVSLAGSGRMNGYLTSVQDEVLTGYGTVRPPELSGTAGDALMRILDIIAPVYPDTRAWFLRNYGSGRTLRSYDLARRVLETELPGTRPEPFAPNRWQGGSNRGGSGFAAIAAARDQSLQSLSEWSCRLPSSGYDAALESARRELVLEAASARARGLARERASGLADPNAVLRLARDLYGAPFGAGPLSPETEDFVQQLAAGVHQIEQQSVTPQGSGFRLLAGQPAEGCTL